MSIAVAEPQLGRVRAFLRLVMIEHSVFALPFALIAAFTAMWRQSRSVHWWQLLLIVVAMVGFNQNWHVEEERPVGGVPLPGEHDDDLPPEPQPA